MKAKDYEEEIWKLFPIRDLRLNVLGLCGEAGELANKVKQSDYKTVFREDMIEELADVLWHVAQCAKILETNLSSLMDISVTKSRERNKNESKI